MGRLIEENSVIEVAENFTFTDENERRKYLDFVRYCVQNSKTAYNAEKVVAEIKRQSVCTNGCLTIGEDEAIDIVKAGGKEVNED